MTMTFSYRADETGKKGPTDGPSVEIWDGRRRETYRNVDRVNRNRKEHLSPE
jgi:hypothetical protein